MREHRKVLLVYGYHQDEAFAIAVGKALEKEKLQGASVVQYQGPHIPREQDHRDFPLRRFVRRYFPFDYLVDVHDSSRAVDTDYYKFPACGFLYFSKKQIPKKLQDVLEDYSKRFEKLLNDRWVERRFIDKWKDMSSKYDALYVELMPRYITKMQAIDYLKVLVEVLVSNPRSAH